MKKLYLLLLFGSVITFGQTQIGSDIDGLFIGEQLGYSVSLSQDGTVLASGAYNNDVNGADSGCVRIYKNISGTWTQFGQNIYGENNFDYSGSCISLSNDGTIVAIGAPKNDANGSNSGQVRVYQNISNNWIKIGQDIDGKTSDDLNGTSVSLSADGSILAIGAIDQSFVNPSYSYVRIFKNISGTWIQIGQDINEETVNDLSGTSVSLSADGTIVAIGATGNDGLNSFYSGCGHVRIYKNISETWTKIGQDIDGEFSSDNSGASVSISGDGSIVAIGAPHSNGNNGYNSGHVKVYKNISNNWIQVGQNINGETVDDKSGSSISLSDNGNILAIGSPYHLASADYKGQVRIFQNVSDNWLQIGQDIEGESSFNFSGYSVSLSKDGTKVAIGSYLNAGNGTNTGHVRVFDLSAFLKSDTFVLDTFSIYPNPTSDFININLENNLILEKVNIYTTLGQLIKSEKSKTIDVKSLAKGNYYIEVITNQGKATKTIIIE